MSRHEVEKDEKKFVFGWDQPLMSFFLQVHDLTFEEDSDNNPVVMLGGDLHTKMYEVDDLVRHAQMHGLHIDHQMQIKLYGEKDDGA